MNHNRLCNYQSFQNVIKVNTVVLSVENISMSIVISTMLLSDHRLNLVLPYSEH